MEQEILIRTSERRQFKTCRQAWKWSYVDNLKPNRTRVALSFGTYIHKCLEKFYKPGLERGPHPAKTAKRVWRAHVKNGGDEFTVPTGGDHVPADELAVHMLENYVDLYGQDDDLEIIAPEMTFQIDIMSDKGKYLFTYVGTIDGVARQISSGRVVLLEHKTGTTLDPFGAPMELDEQAGSYWTFGAMYLVQKGYLNEVDELAGILYNRLRKAFKDPRPTDDQGRALNRDGSVSKKQPVPLFKRELILRGPHDRQNMMQRVRHEAREMRLTREGRLGIYKNPDRHCGYCSYREMCELEETSSDWEEFRDMEYHTWNPYDAHEIREEGHN